MSGTYRIKIKDPRWVDSVMSYSQKRGVKHTPPKKETLTKLSLL